MEKENFITLRTLSYVTLFIFMYYLVYSIFTGLSHPIPAPGDSYDYHIPIAKTIINGSFLTLPHPKLPQWYYPGSAEIPLALFIFLHLPLTLSNILPVLLLSYALFHLGRRFLLPFHHSLLFSLSFVTLNALVRWYNAVSIDVWLSVFYVCLILLLQKSKKTTLYFLLLGFISGMLLGSKYTAIVPLLLVFLLFVNSLKEVVSIKNGLVFLIPFSVFGLFWYMRNLFLVGNPWYGVKVFNLPTVPLFHQTIWQTIMSHPLLMLNAFLAEYKIWAVLCFIPLFFVGKLLAEKKILEQKNSNFLQLSVLGLLNGLFFLFMPTSNQPWIMVSSFRYSYPTFIPLMLAVFLLAQRYQFATFLAYASVASAMIVTSLAYYPKLVFLSIPLSLIVISIFEKKSKTIDNKYSSYLNKRNLKSED